MNYHVTSATHRVRPFCLFLMLLGLSLSCQAALELPGIFGDHMVLQAGKPVPVWGKAEPSVEVTVSFAGQTAKATADDKGMWRGNLAPLKPSDSPQVMTVTAADQSVTFSDVLVGEVWLCSGQSNMAFQLERATGGLKLAEEAKDTRLRLYVVESQHAFQPADNCKGKWVVCTPEAAKRFSAVGYIFGNKLLKSLNRPVGLIQSAVGGTRIQAWMSAPSLASNSHFAFEADRVKVAEKKCAGLWNKYQKQILPKWEKELAAWQAKNPTVDAENMKQWEAAVKKAAEKGDPPPRKPKSKGPKKPHFGGRGKNLPCCLYNAKIHPLQPYALAGCIWYQGESSAKSQTEAEEYSLLLPMMIQDWRAGFEDPKLPFLYVQLPDFNDSKVTWPYLRESQLETLSLPNTGMAISFGLGQRADIHPVNKIGVGERLTRLARVIAYGEKILPSGPIFKSYAVDGSVVKVSFDNVGSGLVAGKNFDNGEFTKIESNLALFELEDEHGKFCPAEARIEGAQVIVCSDRVTNPKGVRYAWAGGPHGNLYNAEGLPASPFNTAVSCRESTLKRIAAEQAQAGMPAGWKPKDGARKDNADSPFIPKDYGRVFTANFDDDQETFSRTEHPQFTTGFFRLNAKDINTCRRLWTNSERQLYFDRDFAYGGTSFGIDPFSVKDGLLTITAKPLSEEHKQALAPLGKGEDKRLKSVLYSSGALSTETQLRKPGQGFDLLYGYWELRAKLPKGRGLWPAFWLVTETHAYWDEVDIFEVLGHQPDYIYQTTHFHDGGGTEKMTWDEHTYKKVDSSDGFHIYGCEIRKDGRLLFFIDGKLSMEVKHTLEKPLYTMLNLAVGGSWPKDPDKTTEFPAKFEIDYLRIYAPQK